MRTSVVVLVKLLTSGLLVSGILPGSSAPSVPRATPVSNDVVRECPYPVTATVSDGFRPPPEKWLAGNRGLSFATVPGQMVLAVAPGVVTFAGPVADAFYVTVRRADGRDVTYSYLASTDRRSGEPISRGDPVGITGPVEFHLGHRDDGTYLDPGPLVDAACGRAHAVLVPVPE